MKVFRTVVAAVAVAAFTILAQTLLTMGASSAETVTTAGCSGKYRDNRLVCIQ